jgi:hypothetical protein
MSEKISIFSAASELLAVKQPTAPARKKARSKHGSFSGT